MKNNVLLFLVLVMIIFVPFVVKAEKCDDDRISINSISIKNKSDNVKELEDAKANGKNVYLSLSMSDIGDDIVYEIVVKNDADVDYDLDNGNFVLGTEYFDYTLESEDNSNIIKANSSKKILLTIKYNKEIPDDAFESGKYNDKKTMVIQLSNDNKETVFESFKNPETRRQSYIILLMVILVIVLITILVLSLKILKNKKIVMLLILVIGLIVLIPLTVNALCKYNIVINSDIEIEKQNMCVTFNSDYEWKDIVDAVKLDHTDCMNVGDTKEVDMGEYGTHIVRIANKSNPSECNEENFSKTACGFVIEFVDIIFKRGFNSTKSNAGGWRDSEIRGILNDEIYNIIPVDLRNGIIDTNVISSHERGVVDNYYTVDKIYLLSTSEVWLKCGTNDIGYDAADTLTRQLDYYESMGVTSTNYDAADKKFNGSSLPWWLRTAHKTSDNYIGNVYYGKTNAYYGHANLVYGVSPAFRLN